MEAAINTPLLRFTRKLTDLKPGVDARVPDVYPHRACFPLHLNCNDLQYYQRVHHRSLPAISVVLSGMKEAQLLRSQPEDFSFAASKDDNQLKIRVKLSGAKTQEIFDYVFDKMVAAAQPIPGFRRQKGGKTPNIPRDILLEVLGPSKVYKQAIKNIINSAVADYVQKNGLKVSKNLKVEESYEDLEAGFEPGEAFSFNAIVHLIESKDSLI